MDITEIYLNASLQARLRSQCRKESGGFGGVGFLRTLEVGFFHPTPELQLNHLLQGTPKLGILTRAY